MSKNRKLLGFILMVSAIAVLYLAFVVYHNKQLRKTSLYYAAQEGNLERVKYLIKQGFPINQNVESSFGRTPLIGAIIQDQVNVFNFLIESGANVNLADADGMTPLMWVATGMTKRP